MVGSFRRFVFVFVTAIAFARPALGQSLAVHGVAAGRIHAVEGQTSWIDGGFGRLTEGAGEANAGARGLRARLHLGLDLRFTETLSLHAQGTLQGEPSLSRGALGGLVEAFLQYRPELTPRTTLRFRAGLFFPPTSLENTERLWQSPYTITLSALNTWIGEEVRLTGLDAQLQRKVGPDDRLDAAGAVFGVDDPAGTLVAWRGWAFGDRLTTLSETLPLPPLASLGPGGAFADQRDDGTKPIDELDHRLGWQARLRWARPGVVLVQGAYTDNGGDRGIYRGQYSWHTRFAQAGLELHLGKALTVVAEGAAGDTGMGPGESGKAHVDVRFRVGYALASWVWKSVRLSARVDSFRNEDRDGTAEPDDERGWAFTGAAFWQPRAFVRLGLEYVDVRASRPAAAFSGANPDTDARRGQAEVRLLF
jgi:hypothetical protein